jgi:hypothetical protein
MSDDLKMIPEDMAERDVANLLKAQLAELEGERAFLSAKHLRGDDYVMRLFTKISEFVEASVTSAKEQAEALGADTARAGAMERGRALIKDVRRKVALLIDQLEDGAATDEEATLIDTLRYDFGLRGRRWRIDVNASIDELLELVHDGVHKHKALFEQTGEPPEFFTAPREAKKTLEASARSYQKESNESIMATRWANALRDEAEDLMNMALKLVNTHAAGSVLQVNLLNVEREQAAKRG